MTLKFEPPTDLVNAYLNRPTSGELFTNELQKAAQMYVQEKDKQKQEAIQKHTTKVADFNAAAPYIQPDQVSAAAAAAGIDIPAYTPPTPSTGTIAGPTPVEAQNQQSMPSEHPAGSPIVQAHAQATGFNPLGLDMSKVGLERRHKSLEDQKLQKELNAPTKPDDKYYSDEQASNLLGGKAPKGFPKDQIPRDAVHLMMSQAKSENSGENQNYIGNAENGDPVNQDKKGNFFVNGQPYHGKIMMKNSETPTAVTRSTSEFAKTVIPHIQDMRDLVKQADEKGYIGPVAGRVYGDFMAGKVGTTGNPDADALLGKLRATDSLLKSGAMKVHFGSKGGSNMYDHFSELLNSGKQSAPMLNGSLDALESFMEGYSNAGKASGNGASSTGGNAPRKIGRFTVEVH